MFAKSENMAAAMENSRHNFLVTDKAFFMENMTSSESLLDLQIFPQYSAPTTRVSDVGRDSRC